MKSSYLWTTVFAAIFLFWGGLVYASEPEILKLWPQGAPGAKGKSANDQPTLILYPAKENPNGTAVVICPGGGYGGLAMGHEGHEIAHWLNGHGISAFICDYRHRGKGYGHPYPLMDAQRAIRTVRANARAWKVDPEKVGIIGFSAGGHLASTCATHESLGDLPKTDAINLEKCRPDFAILCYAVIGFDKPYTHRGSQRNLIGKEAPDELVKFYSNEGQVSGLTCPSFLWHTAEDRAVPVENSIQFFLSCQKNKVPSALHVFEKGRHGIGLAKTNPTARHWPDLCIGWLKQRQFLK
ncbi:MAG: alpha/beta hydrolase [Planctomycetota bacterium]|jgi:acetyl esterase/lipase|nr:alpha/beta hydrolase [Planctomycetota bacterium]